MHRNIDNLSNSKASYLKTPRNIAWIHYEADIMEYYIRSQADPESDHLKKAHSPRELVLERYFLPFVCNYLKDMKADFIPLLIPSQL